MAKAIKKTAASAAKAKKTLKATTKKPIVSKKAAAKKPAARKPAAKKSPARKTDHINDLKAAISKIEKSSAQAFVVAKKQAQEYAKQTIDIISRYNLELKKLATQDKTVQQKLNDAETKLKKKANATNKAAIKKAKQVWTDVKKQQQQVMTQLKQTETVQSMAKNLASKLDFVAKEVDRIAKNWTPAAPAKAKTAAKPKVAKPSVAAKAPEKKVEVKKPAPVIATKPAVVAPAHTQQQPAQKTVFTTPITPQNIAQKPLTGGHTSHDVSGRNPFGDKDNF